MGEKSAIKVVKATLYRPVSKGSFVLPVYTSKQDGATTIISYIKGAARGFKKTCSRLFFIFNITTHYGCTNKKGTSFSW